MTVVYDQQAEFWLNRGWLIVGEDGVVIESCRTEEIARRRMQEIEAEQTETRKAGNE